MEGFDLSTITNAYVGSTPVSAIYKGGELVWPIERTFDIWTPSFVDYVSSYNGTYDVTDGTMFYIESHSTIVTSSNPYQRAHVYIIKNKQYSIPDKTDANMEKNSSFGYIWRVPDMRANILLDNVHSFDMEMTLDLTDAPSISRLFIYPNKYPFNPAGTESGFINCFANGLYGCRYAGGETDEIVVPRISGRGIISDYMYTGSQISNYMTVRENSDGQLVIKVELYGVINNIIPKDMITLTFTVYG